MNHHSNGVTPGLSVSNEEFDVTPVHCVCNGTANDGAGPLHQVNVVLYQLSLVPVLVLEGGGREEGREGGREGGR